MRLQPREWTRCSTTDGLCTSSLNVDAEDSVVKERIELAFKKNRSLAKSDVHVASVNTGVVLLSGDAADIVEHLRAIETAYLVKGVRGFDAIVLKPCEPGVLVSEIRRLLARATEQQTAPDGQESIGDG